VATFEIDDEYVDIDFSKYPQFVPGFNGYGSAERFGDYAAAAPVLARREIIAEAEKTAAEGTGNANLVVEVKNQRNEGSCVGNASTQGLQVIQARRLGKDRVTLLSAIATYKQIGRSPNSGAMVDDSMEALESVGTLPLDTPANREKFGDQVMPATGFYTKFPSNWKETARQFRLGEVLVVRGFEALLSAMLCGHPVVVGREGHSILYLDVIVRGGRLYALYVNSWGKWGQGAGDFSYGFGLDTENQIKKSAGWAYAMRSMVERT
jgi:hypothetical protein